MSVSANDHTSAIGFDKDCSCKMQKTKRQKADAAGISGTQLSIEGLSRVPSQISQSKLVKSIDSSESALVRPEMHMFLRPYFLLDKKADRLKGIDTREMVKVNGKEIERRWCVKPDAEFGMPGPLERDVLLAIYEIAYENFLSRNLIVPEVMALGTMSAFMRRLGLSRCGKNSNAVKLALKRLVHTTCKSENSFFDKSKNLFVTESFQLLRAVGIAGESDGNGGVVEQSFVQFDDRVRNNLNARYLMVIDLLYMRELKSEISKHLYPILSHWLWRSAEKGYWRVQYHWLAQHLGIKAWDKVWRAKQQLEQANNELLEKGYISHCLWDGWDLLYFPGDAHKGEQLRRQVSKNIPASSLDTPKVHALKLEQPESGDHDPLLPLLALFAQGVPMAEPLLKQRGLTTCQAQALCIEKGIKVPIV